MTKSVLAAVSIVVCWVSLGFSQQAVSLRNTYERIVCVVPLAGSGQSADDPRRPMFAPAPPAAGQPLSRSGIIAFAYQESDDGQFAIVEFVALDRSAFSAILNANRPDVKVFEKGTARRADIETVLRQYKRDFDLDSFGVRVP